MRIILTSITFALTATSAYAADAIVYNEPVPVVMTNTFSWTGGYIGVNAGYGWGKTKNRTTDSEEQFIDITALYEDDPDRFRSSELDGTHNIRGFVGGVQAGYNWQFNNGFVLGAEADFQGSNVKGEGRFNANGLGEFKAGTKVEWFGTVRARLGYTPVERFLVYGTAGLAYGKVKTSYNYTHIGLDGFDEGSSSSKTKAGWTVGGGTEYAITNNWTLKSEYLFTDLGKSKGSASFADGFQSYDFSNKVQFHTVRVGLNYKF